MNILTDVAVINKAIASIAKRGKQLDKDIHIAGVSCINHASVHGDTTLLDKLVQALPKGARKNAFVEWTLAYAQVRLLNPQDKNEAARIKAGALFKLDRDRTLDIDGAMATSWVEFKPEPDVLTVFDLQGAVAQLVKKYNSANQKHIDIKGMAEAKAELQALLDSMG